MVPAYVTIMAGNISDIQRQKENDYKNYVIEHITNVKRAWSDMKANTEVMEYLKSIPGFDNDIVEYLIINHDNSKFGEEEWEPYRKNFFPIDDDEKDMNKDDFQKAWKHHYLNNMHHWNYWSETKAIRSMSINYVVEMCCDWIAMSTKFGGNALDWYKKQTDIILALEKQKWVVDILSKFYKK